MIALLIMPPKHDTAYRPQSNGYKTPSEIAQKRVENKVS